MSAALDEVAGLLGGLGAARTRLEVHARIEQGLSSEALVHLAGALEISPAELATSVLQIPARTFARRRGDKRLVATESDRLYRAARVVAHACDVFEDRAKAAAWLKRAQLALDGARPIDLLATDVGSQEVSDLLGRIEFGMAA